MSAAAGPDGPLKNMHCDGYERPPQPKPYSSSGLYWWKCPCFPR